MVSKQYLIRNWVQYLKNNNIVSSNVSPGGSLTYRRRPTKADLVRYLSYITDLTEHVVIGIVAQAQRLERADREYTKPRDLSVDIWNRPAGIDESSNIRDTGRHPISDTAIDYAFDLVVKYREPKPKATTADVERVMNVIRNDMLPNQRKYLWELLNAG